MTTHAMNSRPRFVRQRRDDTSRLFALALGRYFQHVCRLQRALAEGDLDLAIIAGAAALAATESLMRDATLRQEFADIDVVIGDRQRGCNALSMAEATGLPRETVRRKINRLVEMGVLVRRGAGNYVWQPGLMQSPAYRQMFDEWSAETLRFANECQELGVFAVEALPL